jgi:hypothetical protein
MPSRIAGIVLHCREQRVGANSGLMHRNKQYLYSITSPAMASRFWHGRNVPSEDVNCREPRFAGQTI